MSLQDTLQFIVRANCPDCFHPECLRRADLARELMQIEADDPIPYDFDR